MSNELEELLADIMAAIDASGVLGGGQQVRAVYQDLGIGVINQLAENGYVIQRREPS